ncbi:MAG TPA: YkgJ family cysteine cluster protein [Rhodanobacteraceae bacterium]|nr:YkgJ family cysteine cluster protein [Rhodanobacteraceae bacterium]
MHLSREQSAPAATATFEHTAAALRARCDAATCAALCRRLNAVIDSKIEALKDAGASVACAPGCDYCCHLRVDVFAHEATALLDYLRTRAAPDEAAQIERRIRANAARVDALTAEQHRRAGIACAFLSNGLCSAHDVRPSACATYHSLSRARCEHAFQHPADIGTARNARPALLELQVFGAAQIEATSAARKAVGLAGEQVELHQALRALLDDGAVDDSAGVTVSVGSLRAEPKP